MFALVEAHCAHYNKVNARRDGKLFGDCKLISVHRSLTAAQKAWRKTDNTEHNFRGILTKGGLVNYFGSPLADCSSFGKVEVRMGVFPEVAS